MYLRVQRQIRWGCENAPSFNPYRLVLLVLVATGVLLMINPTVRASEVTKHTECTDNPKQKMYRIVLAEKLPQNIRKFRVVRQDGTPINQLEAYQALSQETSEGENLREELRTNLLSQNLDAYFWETPPATLKSASTTPFEYVVVPAPALEDIPPDFETFSEKFTSSSKVVSFLSLGRDAMLIAPCPQGKNDYSHLAKFIQNAPTSDVHELFLHVGQQIVRRLGTDPLWVSTSGLGVYWLHVRLDSVPKYYTFRDYKRYP